MNQWRFMIAVNFVFLSLIPSHTNAAAGPQCSWFIFQDDAQAAMSQFVYAEGLDPDGDGVACNQLPPRPAELIGAEAARINRVEDDLTLVGASAHRNIKVVLAGIDFTQAAGCEMDATAILSEMFPDGTNVFILPDSSVPIQELGGVDNVQITGWVYGVDPDGQTPFLANQRIVESGVGKAAPAGLGSPLVTSMLAAEAIAQQRGIGIWGTCEAPNLAPGPTQTPFGQILDVKGNGDQLSALFTVPSDGTYRLTANGSASLLFVDLYDQYGNWIPGFSITASGGGIFSSGGFLSSGQYYVQVQANGVWWITMEPLV